MKYLKFFPLTLFCVALIWFLCFMNPPHTDLDSVPEMDKLVHFIMYAGTVSMFWLEYELKFNRKHLFSEQKLVLFSLVIPIVMGGVIELGQAYLTGGHRSGDWFDLLADTLGVVAGTLLGRRLVQWLVGKWRKRKN